MSALKVVIPAVLSQEIYAEIIPEAMLWQMAEVSTLELVLESTGVSGAGLRPKARNSAGTAMSTEDGLGSLLTIFTKHFKGVFKLSISTCQLRQGSAQPAPLVPDAAGSAGSPPVPASGQPGTAMITLSSHTAQLLCRFSSLCTLWLQGIMMSTVAFAALMLGLPELHTLAVDQPLPVPGAAQSELLAASTRKLTTLAHAAYLQLLSSNHMPAGRHCGNPSMAHTPPG